MSAISFLSDRKLWNHQEDQLIIQLVSKHGIGSWIPIASEMKAKFFHHPRTSKQIRQRWHNHLSPEINKSSWSQQQQNTIFQIHNKIGSKWKQIAKYLNNRTDNAVKNHFYSTLRRSLRRINKFYGFKNSTNQMKNLKPSTLTYLVEKSHQSSQNKNLIKKIFQYAKQKPKKDIIQQPSIQKFQRFQQQKRKFQQLLSQLDNFKQIYNLMHSQQFSLNKKCKISNSNSSSLRNIPSEQLQGYSNLINSQKKQRKSRKVKQLKQPIMISLSIDKQQDQSQLKIQFEQILAQKQMNTIDSTFLQNYQPDVLMEEQKQDQQFYFGNDEGPATHWFQNQQRMDYLGLSIDGHIQNNHMHQANYACLHIQGDFNQI